MTYKLLTNVIASGSQVQHVAGEIVALDAQVGEDLVQRKLAKQVDGEATHLWGQPSAGGSTGGKPVNEQPAPTETPATPPAPQEPTNPKEDEEDLEQDAQIDKAAAVGTPEQPAPTQPKPSEVAAAAAQVK